MRKVFWDDPYQHTLTTKVASMDGNRILLEETIAFSSTKSQLPLTGRFSPLKTLKSCTDPG